MGWPKDVSKALPPKAAPDQKRLETGNVRLVEKGSEERSGGSSSELQKRDGGVACVVCKDPPSLMWLENQKGDPCCDSCYMVASRVMSELKKMGHPWPTMKEGIAGAKLLMKEFEDAEKKEI